MKEIKVPFERRNLRALEEYIHATVELETFWFLHFEVQNFPWIETSLHGKKEGRITLLLSLTKTIKEIENFHILGCTINFLQNFKPTDFTKLVENGKS